MDSGAKIALAGIIGSAVVGVAGITGTWFAGTADRSNQRALAHQALVYDRRAQAELTALALVSRQRAQLESRWTYRTRRAGTWEPFRPIQFAMASDADAEVRSRLEAFASGQVIAAFASLESVIQRASDAEATSYEVAQRVAPTDALAANTRALQVLYTAVDDFQTHQVTLERLVRRDLS